MYALSLLIKSNRNEAKWEKKNDCGTYKKVIQLEIIPWNISEWEIMLFLSTFLKLRSLFGIFTFCLVVPIKMHCILHESLIYSKLLRLLFDVALFIWIKFHSRYSYAALILTADEMLMLNKWRNNTCETQEKPNVCFLTHSSRALCIMYSVFNSTVDGEIAFLMNALNSTKKKLYDNLIKSVVKKAGYFAILRVSKDAMRSHRT